MTFMVRGHVSRGQRVHLWVAAAAVLALGLAAPAMLRVARSSSPAPVWPDACLDCHEAEAHALSGTAHDPAAVASCLGCHAGPATDRHLEDPDASPAVNPGTLRADSLTAVCAACHAHPHALNLYERDPHAEADLSCLACHRVHGNEHTGLLRDPEPDLCLECHSSVRGDFALVSRHPVDEGVVACSDCHLSAAQSAKQRVATGPGGTCVSCHAVFAGPFPFEHQAAVDYSTEEGGCLNCHAAHGSTQPRLLRQPYEAPHYDLCTQCHVVPGHVNNANHGTLFAGVACNECHVDVHGSYESRHLLSPALQAQGCFALGCHQF
jgi:DmsE family decaheme c-type cytochrome